MDGIALMEVAPGLWVRPEQVMAVRTTREHTHGTLTLKPAVTLLIAGLSSEIGWEFASWDDATGWAAGIAAKINAALQGSIKPT